MTTSPTKNDAAQSVDRRALLATLAASGAMLAASAAEAQESHEHNHSAAHEGHDNATAAHQALINAALDCVNKGSVCSTHCIDLLGKGDTSIIGCLRTVSAMLPACTALARLGALDAKRLKEYAEVCAKICDDCREECKKHQDHHAVCKACAESCKTCADECRKLV